MNEKDVFLSVHWISECPLPMIDFSLWKTTTTCRKIAHLPAIRDLLSLERSEGLRTESSNYRMKNYTWRHPGHQKTSRMTKQVGRNCVLTSSRFRNPGTASVFLLPARIFFVWRYFFHHDVYNASYNPIRSRITGKCAIFLQVVAVFHEDDIYHWWWIFTNSVST